MSWGRGQIGEQTFAYTLVFAGASNMSRGGGGVLGIKGFSGGGKVKNKGQLPPPRIIFGTALMQSHSGYMFLGLGETWVSLARSALTQFFHGRAADHCQSAILCLTRAASLRPDLSCLWKLLGDACTLLNTLPEELVKWDGVTCIDVWHLTLDTLGLVHYIITDPYG